jgi:hypothetical protein
MVVAILEATGVERQDRFRLGGVPGQLQLRSSILAQMARGATDLAKSLSPEPYLAISQVEPTPLA